MNRALEAACTDWREFLGADGVVTDAEALATRGRTTLWAAPQPAAVVRPTDRGQVPDIVRVAAAHGVPLYPISGGKNWGWGDACPVDDGTVVLDLSRLDRVLEVDEEVGYAVVEPGVNQGALAARLEETAWVADCSSAGPDASVLGSIVDRAIGQTAFSERVAYAAGMEVVLADGTVVGTGLGAYAGNRAGHAMRWGVGPWIDGLFTQSSMGIVLSLALWLMPRPAVADGWMCTVADADLEAFIDRLRMLRIRGVLSGSPHVFPVGPASERRWLTVSAVSGSAAWVELATAEAHDVLAGISRAVRFDDGDLADPANVPRLLGELDLPDVPHFREFLFAGTSFARGHPLQLSPAFVRNYVGGDAQRDGRTPTSPDPLDNDWGFAFAWPVARATGTEVRRLIEVVGGTLARFDRPLAVTLSIPSGRAAVAVTRVVFDRSDPEDTARAEVCSRELLHATLAAGYPPGRSTIAGMRDLDPDRSPYWETVRRIKAALDPTGVIAPGRYLPAPT